MMNFVWIIVFLLSTVVLFLFGGIAVFDSHGFARVAYDATHAATSFYMNDFYR